MKSTLIVSDMNCANCAKKIAAALEATHVLFEIKLDEKLVIIDGDNDMVAIAKKTIDDIGFTVA